MVDDAPNEREPSGAASGSALHSDALDDALSACGALAVTYSDAADDPVLEPGVGEVRLWKSTRVTALFDTSLDAHSRCVQVEQTLGLAPGSASAQEIPDRAWALEVSRHLQPLRFGARLWVAPSGTHPPFEDATVLRLDPGLAFGTGTHATTALCLEALERLETCGDLVIDFGCGSGILALCALQLGWRHAQCVDVDPQARTATLNNARRNTLLERIEVFDEHAALASASLIFANILAQPLIELSAQLASACASGGRLILSGILASQKDEVVRAYAPWFDMTATTARDGWACIELSRKMD